jgi:hypothetical protein
MIAPSHPLPGIVDVQAVDDTLGKLLMQLFPASHQQHAR